MARAWNARNALLRMAAENGRALTTLERRAFRDLTKVYKGASAELVGMLESRQRALEAEGLDEDQVLAALARDQGLQQQLQQRLAELNSDAQAGVELAAKNSTSLGRTVGEMEVGAVQRGLNMTLDLAFNQVDFASIEVGLPNALAQLSQSNQALAQLLLTQLRAGLVRGESFPDLVKRLLSADTGLLARGKLSAMLGARRNIITGNNAARDLLYQLLGQDVPGLMKQAVAAISQRTTDTCLRVHGQIRPLNGYYDLEGEPRFRRQMKYPAFHWNCRTTSVAYHADFERGAKITTDDMTKAAQAELERRAKDNVQEIHPEHATSGA